MLLGLLLIATWPFWAAIVVFCLLMAFLMENDREGWSTFSLVLFIAATIAFTDLASYSPVTWMAMHWGTLLLGVVGYFVGGIVYAVWLRWPAFVYDYSYAVRMAREEYARRYPRPTEPENMDHYNANLDQHLREAVRGYREDGPPLVRKHKARITFWMMYWVWSALGFLLHKPVRYIYRWAQQVFEGHMQTMSDAIYNKASK